jgi:hypothetical protein
LEVVMVSSLRTNWTRIATGLLVAAVIGLGGAKAYERLAGDCCQPGAACCHPGSPCCHAKQLAQR